MELASNHPQQTQSAVLLSAYDLYRKKSRSPLMPTRKSLGTCSQIFNPVEVPISRMVIPRSNDTCLGKGRIVPGPPSLATSPSLPRWLTCSNQRSQYSDEFSTTLFHMIPSQSAYLRRIHPQLLLSIPLPNAFANNPFYYDTHRHFRHHLLPPVILYTSNSNQKETMPAQESCACAQIHIVATRELPRYFNELNNLCSGCEHHRRRHQKGTGLFDNVNIERERPLASAH